MAVTVRKLSEVPRNVVNHAGRGDARGVPTRANLDFQRQVEKKSPEELRVAADEQLRQQNWDERYEAEYEPMFALFAKRHPELRKHREHNSTAICLELETPEGLAPMQAARRPEPNMWDLEMAYDRAQAKGKLLLDKDIVRQQRIEAVERQTDPRGFTEQELYDMPQGQLRALANGNYDPLGPK